MTRGMALLLGLMVLAIALFVAYVLVPRQGDYFDPALSRNDYPCSLYSSVKAGPLDPDFDSWFSQPLRDVGEPSLFRHRPTDGTTIRFTFLPSFLEPVIVRIEDVYGERPRLTAYSVPGQFRPARDRKVSRELTPEEAMSIREFITASHVLDQAPDSCISGVDGDIFVIEASGPDGYRFINRWSPRDGPVFELGNRMFALTGWWPIDRPLGRYERRPPNWRGPDLAVP